MSLILEALKKSERDRQERLASSDDASSTGTQLRDEGTEMRADRRWPIIVGLAVCIVIVGSAAGYRFLYQPKPVVVASSPIPSASREMQDDVAASTIEPAMAAGSETPEAAQDGPPLATADLAADAPAVVPDNDFEPAPETPLVEAGDDVVTATPAPAEASLDGTSLAQTDDPVPAAIKNEAADAAPIPEPVPKAETDTTATADSSLASVPTVETVPPSGTEADTASTQGLQIPPADVAPVAEPNIPSMPRKPVPPPRLASNEPLPDVAQTGLSAAGHYQRASALEQEGLYDRALAHYTEALLLRPDYAEALYGRAWIHIRRQAFGEAVRNFDDLIALNPAMAPAYFGRGWAHELAGNEQGAIDDYSRAIELAPNEPGMRFNRAILNLYAGNYIATETDLQAIRANAGEREETFAEIWLFVARGRSGVPVEDVLPALRQTPARGGWPGIVLDHLLDKAPFEDVLTETAADHYRETEARQCIAYYFAGQLALMRGKRGDAANFFRLAVATDATAYRQYWAAKLELERMGIAE